MRMMHPQIWPLDEDVKLVSEGHSVYVPLGALHRMENPEKLPMILIEVQIGTYFGEDDIHRYPAPADNYNLHTIKDMKSRFGVNVGLSDHTLDNTTAIAAVALGAVMIEKHVTLDKNGGGPDDSFSLEEDGLRELCTSTKTAWQSLGKVNYERTEAEKGNVKFRRSLYYVRTLKEGDIITENDIRSVRPGFGLPPKYYDKLIGSKVTMSVEENSPVTLASVNIELD
jgi:sialic acid synthase SpsE